MTDLDDRMRAAFEGLAERYAGPGEPTAAVLAAVRRHRRRRAATLAATVAVATAAAVVGATALVGGSRPVRQPTLPATTGLPADQFVGLLLPPHPGKDTQYAWTFSLRTGKPLRRLAPALGVLGVSGDRRWALVEQVPASPAACAFGLPSVLASTTTGEIRQPWPAGYGIESSMLAGGTAVAIGVPTGQRPAGGVSGRGCPPPVLLSYDLASRQVRTYRLPAGDASHEERAAAVSVDGRRVVLDNIEHPDHQTFRLVWLDPDRDAVSITPIPAAPPGCTTTGFAFRPPSGVLTENTACGRTMRITGYDPATLRRVDQLSIPDPPGSSVTFFAAAWDRSGTQALIEGLHDQTSPRDTSEGFRKIFILRGGRLTGPVTTQAYGVTW